ncbi:acyltransferase family protein [Streptomyces sp. NBC_01142]|uniref:acyltransferase family protein n=1 Tax=Streptomyces sp. NBC_01142 TaxID=2975865 RepID=UPI002255B7B4|nr:acyltransferase family protein [Streptomyces sp. NBC_01142]MCX4825336.1 acyltransferase family protein [Streptomyces sp. NBC_01142]
MSSTTRDRDPFFDNAKFLLIALVALGHSWEQVIGGTHALRAVHTVVYAFHMPAFILLSGYFSRSFTGRPDQMRRLISGVLAPYLIFEVVYTAVYHWTRDQPFSITPTAPSYLCWFMIALFVWRLSAPLWQAVRFPVPIAVAVSLAAGMTVMGGDLALPRVLMFLPWFVLGLKLRAEHFALLRTRIARRWALPAFVAAGFLAHRLAPQPDDHWLSMDAGYGVLEVSPGHYLVLRMLIFAASAVLVAAFLALVPGRRTWFTALGAVTLYPYLLHGILIRTAGYVGAFDVVKSWGLPGELLLSVCAVAAVVLLSTPPVRRVARPLVEPRFPRRGVPDKRVPVPEPAPAGGRRDP